jgi:hypothetical protein
MSDEIEKPDATVGSGVQQLVVCAMQRSMIRFRFGFGGVFPIQIRLYQVDQRLTSVFKLTMSF